MLFAWSDVHLHKDLCVLLTIRLENKVMMISFMMSYVDVDENDWCEWE